ncbi:hypothetical protein Tco_1180319, partial [Tanacetum coccineum]
EVVSSADLPQIQVDLDCVHTEDELHLHGVRVVQDMHEADQITDRFTLIVLSALRCFDKENKQVRSVITDLKVQIKMEMEIPSSIRVKCKVIKLKNFKKYVSTSFQDKEEFEHVGPKVTKITRCKDHKMMKRLCMDDDLKEVQDHCLLCKKEQAHYISLQDKDKV